MGNFFGSNRSVFLPPPPPPVKTPEEIRKIAQKGLGLDVYNYYNFAIAGHVKTGKSTLINAIRGLKKGDAGFADVDFTECTQDIRFYTYPNLPYIRIYDIPGSGTLTHDANSYFEGKQLCAFDCLIIMVQNTVGAEEIAFAQKAINQYHQPVVFVRSKCDQDLDNMLDADDIEEITQSEINKYLQKMTQVYKKEIETKANDLHRVPCFFISGRVLLKYVKGQNTMLYHEKQLLDFVIHQAKSNRAIVD